MTVRREHTAMSILRVLSHQGDTQLAWDPRAAEMGDSEARAAVEEAERVFRDQRSRGATAFKVDPASPAERIDSFDPQAEQIVMVPRVAGG